MAAEYAVQFVKTGMVIGLGHGSTAIFAIRKIARFLQEGVLADIIAIPCSSKVYDDAAALGIPLSTLDEYPVIDVTIDGADEVDPDGNVIKGGGGALLREKIVAQATTREIIVVDNSKVSSILGTHWAVPLEVAAFGLESNLQYLQNQSAIATLRLKDDGSHFISDQGNLIVDANFGPIQDPYDLARRLERKAGILEHGLFLDLVTDVIIASDDGIEHRQYHRKA